MLVGQEIGLSEVVWISLFGMAVATIAIIMLMVFVIIMSKIILQGKKVALAKKAISEKAAPVQASPIPTAAIAVAASTPDLQPAIPAPAIVTEDEVASITAALCVKTGMCPKQFRIVSITNR